MNAMDSDSVNRPDVRIERSRRAILNAARVQLLYNPNASLSDIAQRAEVGRATLYRLYDSREALVLAVGMDCLDAFNRATAHIEHQAHSIRHAFQLLFEAILPLEEEYQFVSRLGEAADYPAELQVIYEHQHADMVALVDEAKRGGKINKHHPSEWVVYLIDAQLYAAQVLIRRNGFTVEQAAETACLALFQGVQ